MADKKKYITVAQAAERMEVTPHYIRKLLREGKLIGDQKTKSCNWRVEQESFEKYKGTDSYKLDLAQMDKGVEISIKEAVENVEEYFGDIISYIANPGSPFSIVEPNDCIQLDDLLFHMVPKHKGSSKKFKKITLFLHSGGGILEAAVKFIKIIRLYAEEFEVIVPMMAKSAATVMALNADKIYFTALSELGPVDPIVQSPTNPGLRIPATSIDNFLRYYGTMEKDVNDTNTLLNVSLKKKIEENLDPYLLGSYKGALMYSQESIKDALTNYSMKDKSAELQNEAIEEFTIKHYSHSHPITPDALEKFGIGEVVSNTAKLSVIKLLLSVYQQFMGMNNIVKIVGNREENKNVSLIPAPGNPQVKQVLANTI